MKRLLFAILCLCISGAAQAGLMITNGDFETDAPASNVTDVVGWYDTQNTDAAWWVATWYGPTVSPTGTSVMGLSYMNTTSNWAYQSIGYNDEGLTEVAISFEVGSFTDAGSARDLGVTLSIYKSDGSFVAAEASDITGASGITLVDTIDILSESVVAGSVVSYTKVLSLAGTTANDELYLRISNYAGAVGEPWTAIDNVSIVPEPATLLLLTAGGLMARRKIS